MDTAQRIHNLIYSYAEFVDDGDFDAVASLFARGSISYSPGGLSLHGPQEVVGFFTRTILIDPSTGTPRTVHRVSNVILVPGEREWHARSRYDVTQQLEGRSPEFIASGRYFDTFRVDGPEVYFHHRKVVSEYLGECSQHLTLAEEVLSTTQTTTQSARAVGPR